MFITGTDTNCGKTTVTIAMLHLLRSYGWNVAGMKPVASGSRLIAGVYYNDDALRLQAASSFRTSYSTINPYAFPIPIAPELAAAEQNTTIDTALIQQCFHTLTATADAVLVEGIGGWRVPLGNGLFVADLPKILNLPILLVVGVRLGCINHALLTTRDILNQGHTLAGWIANQLEPSMLQSQETIKSLAQYIPAPCLATIPAFNHEPDVNTLVRYFFLPTTGDATTSPKTI